MIKGPEMGRLPWIIHLGPKCLYKCSYNRQAEGHSYPHKHTHEKAVQRCSRERFEDTDFTD